MWLCRISGFGTSLLFLSEQNTCMQIMHISAILCNDLCYLCVFFYYRLRVPAVSVKGRVSNFKGAVVRDSNSL